MSPGGKTPQVEPGGFLLECPHCRQELRVAGKYAGARVQCKLCHGRFLLEPDHPNTQPVGFFAECPHCLEELRANWRYRRARVACKLCGGRIQFVPIPVPTAHTPATPGHSPMVASS